MENNLEVLFKEYYKKEEELNKVEAKLKEEIISQLPYRKGSKVECRGKQGNIEKIYVTIMGEVRHTQERYRIEVYWRKIKTNGENYLYADKIANWFRDEIQVIEY